MPEEAAIVPQTQAAIKYFILAFMIITSPERVLILFGVHFLFIFIIYINHRENQPKKRRNGGQNGEGENNA